MQWFARVFKTAVYYFFISFQMNEKFDEIMYVRTFYEDPTSVHTSELQEPPVNWWASYPAPCSSPSLSVSLLIPQSPWWIKVTFTVMLHQALSRFKSLPTLTNHQILLI